MTGIRGSMLDVSFSSIIQFYTVSITNSDLVIIDKAFDMIDLIVLLFAGVGLILSTAGLPNERRILRIDRQSSGDKRDLVVIGGQSARCKFVFADILELRVSAGKGRGSDGFLRIRILQAFDFVLEVGLLTVGDVGSGADDCQRSGCDGEFALIAGDIIIGIITVNFYRHLISTDVLALLTLDKEADGIHGRIPASNSSGIDGVRIGRIRVAVLLRVTNRCDGDRGLFNGPVEGLIIFGNYIVIKLITISKTNFRGIIAYSNSGTVRIAHELPGKIFILDALHFGKLNALLTAVIGELVIRGPIHCSSRLADGNNASIRKALGRVIVFTGRDEVPNAIFARFCSLRIVRGPSS